MEWIIHSIFFLFFLYRYNFKLFNELVDTAQVTFNIYIGLYVILNSKHIE